MNLATPSQTKTNFLSIWQMFLSKKPENLRKTIALKKIVSPFANFLPPKKD
jgi:hypothetical protein